MPALPRPVPRPSLRLLVPTLALAALACAGRPAAAQSCFQGLGQFNLYSGQSGFPIVGAVFDTVVSPTKALEFDLPAGRLTLRAEGKFWTLIRARDRFDVAGVAPGTPVPLVVELHVDGTIATVGCGGSNCWGNLGVRIDHGADVAAGVAEENIFSGPPRAVQKTVQLAVVIVAGQPETIELELYAYGAAEFLETGIATFRFLDLPPGTSITSCHGYAGAPTPARAASWGGVKSTYR